STVMSNIGFYQALEEQDIKSIKTKVGDRFVVEEMRENGYNLGGEQSGHIVFLDHSTTGDGLLTGIQLIKVMDETDLPLSELAAAVTTFPQELINVRVSDKEAVMEHPRVQATIGEVEDE
ncbi:phosphoglucosamine mutase, partial [Salmonella enterica subsp. enterica serovar Enteritidis]